MANKELYRIYKDVAFRRIALSEAAKKSHPLLRGIVSDQELAWIAQEVEGYALIPGMRQGWPAPPGLPEYRYLYAHKAAFVREFDGAMLDEPVEFPKEANRLNVTIAPLRDIEHELRHNKHEYAIGALHHQSADGFRIHAIVDHNQLLRLTESFRLRFHALLARILGIEFS